MAKQRLTSGEGCKVHLSVRTIEETMLVLQMSDVNYSKLKTKSHGAYRLFYHLVLTMKYRKKCLNADMLERLEMICADLIQKWGGDLVEFGGESDHVHLLFELDPTVRLSDFIKNLKSVSARKMRQEFAEHLKSYYWKPYFWNRAYAVVTTGGRAPIHTLLKYIENQDDPRRLGQPLTTE